MAPWVVSIGALRVVVKPLSTPSYRSITEQTCITSVGLCFGQKKKVFVLVTHFYASKINFYDLSATDTELPSAPPSVQLDEGPTSHVLRLYKRKKNKGQCS